MSLKKHVSVQCSTQQICFKKACSPRQTSQCSYLPGFLPASQQVTAHCKCKRSFSYETVSAKQVRITSQPACFPAKTSGTYLGNQLVCFPVFHNKRKLITFPTDLRKRHHNKENTHNAVKTTCTNVTLQSLFTEKHIYSSFIIKTSNDHPPKTQLAKFVFSIYILDLKQNHSR